MEANADRLTAAYIKMRDKKAELTKEYDTKIAEIEQQMLMVEDELKKLFDDVGADSIKTAHGLVYRSVKTQYQVNDWDSMYKFIKEHDVPQVLQQRISTTNMKQFLNDNPDLMPMGMNRSEEHTSELQSH